MKNYTTPYTKSQDKSTASANSQPVRQGTADNQPPIESIDYLINKTHSVGSPAEKKYTTTPAFHGKLSKNWIQVTEASYQDFINDYNAGYSVAPALFDTSNPQKSNRSSATLKHITAILFDGDEWGQVEHDAPRDFDTLYELYPNIKDDFHFIAESPSSRSDAKPELRLRLGFIFPRPVLKTEQHLLESIPEYFIEKYPFIASAVATDPARFSIGNYNKPIINTAGTHTKDAWEACIADADKSKLKQLRDDEKKEKEKLLIEQARAERIAENKRLNERLRAKGIDTKDWDRILDSKTPLDEFMSMSGEAVFAKWHRVTHLSKNEYVWQNASNNNIRSCTLHDQSKVRIYSNSMRGASPEPKNTKAINAHRFYIFVETGVDITAKPTPDEWDKIQDFLYVEFGIGCDPQLQKDAWKAKQQAVRRARIADTKYQPKVRLSVNREYKHEVISIDEARAENDAGLLDWIKTESRKRKKSVAVMNSAPGTGKTTSALLYESIFYGCKTSEQAMQAFKSVIERALRGCESEEDEDLIRKENVLHRARMFNRHRDDWDLLPHGLGEDERPCIQPDVVDRFARRGLNTEIVCQHCPARAECGEVGYKYQTKLEETAVNIFAPFGEEFVVDERHAERAERMSKGKIFILDEPDPAQLTQFREVSDSIINDIKTNFSIPHPSGAEPDPLLKLFSKLCVGMGDAISSKQSEAEMLSGKSKSAADVVCELDSEINNAIKSLINMPDTSPSVAFKQTESEKKRKTSLNGKLKRVDETLKKRLESAEIVDRCLQSRVSNETQDAFLSRIKDDAREMWHGLPDIEQRITFISKYASVCIAPGADFEIEAERAMHMQWAEDKRATASAVFERDEDDNADAERDVMALRYLDEFISNVPVYLTFRKGTSADSALYADIVTSTSRVSVRVAGRTDEDIYEPHIRLEREIDSRFVNTGVWEFRSITHWQAFDAGVFSKDNPPTSHRKLLTSIKLFISQHNDVSTAPCHYEPAVKDKQNVLRYNLAPTLNVNNAIFLTASDAYGHVHSAFTGTGVDVKYITSGVPEWKDGCDVYQIANGKYTTGQSLVKKSHNDTLILDSYASECYENLIKPCIDAGAGVLVVGNKKISKTSVGKELAEAGILRNHVEVESLNEFADRDIVFVFHYEPPPEQVRAESLRIYRNPSVPLSFDRVDSKTTIGAVSYIGKKYKDERVQSVYERQTGMRHLQALMRLRPNIHENKIIVLLSSVPVPQIPMTPTLFNRREMPAIKSQIEERGIAGFKLWADDASDEPAETRDDIVGEMHAEGKSQRQIAEEVGLSKTTIQKTISENATRATPHVESPHSPEVVNSALRVPRAKKTTSSTSSCESLPEDAHECTAGVESPHSNQQIGNLPETADEGTSHVESPHSKPYHKDVGGILIILMSDGKERRTSEIVAAIDASQSKVKGALQKKVKSGEILKVRHGFYLIAGADPQPEPEPADESTAHVDSDPQQEDNVHIPETGHEATAHVDSDDATIIKSIYEFLPADKKIFTGKFREFLGYGESDEDKEYVSGILNRMHVCGMVEPHYGNSFWMRVAGASEATPPAEKLAQHAEPQPSDNACYPNPQGDIERKPTPSGRYRTAT